MTCRSRSRNCSKLTQHDMTSQDTETGNQYAVNKCIEPYARAKRLVVDQHHGLSLEQVLQSLSTDALQSQPLRSVVRRLRVTSPPCKRTSKLRRRRLVLRETKSACYRQTYFRASRRSRSSLTSDWPSSSACWLLTSRLTVVQSGAP